MLEILQSYDKLHEPLGQTSLEPFQVISSVSRAADATSALFDCKICYASIKMPSFSVCLPQDALVCTSGNCCVSGSSAVWSLDGSQRKRKEKP